MHFQNVSPPVCVCVCVCVCNSRNARHSNWMYVHGFGMNSLSCVLVLSDLIASLPESHWFNGFFVVVGLLMLCLCFVLCALNEC